MKEETEGSQTEGSQTEGTQLSPLALACRDGLLDRVKELLSGEDEKKRCNLACPDSQWTPLHYACLRGHSGVAETLLLCGASVTSRTLQHDTVLHILSFM